MLNLFFGFEGTISQLKFILAIVFLEIWTVVGSAAIFYNDQRAEDSSPEILAFRFYLYMFSYAYCSTAVISNRLGWRGMNGAISWIFIGSTALYGISEVSKEYFEIVTDLPAFIAIFSIIVFIVACFRPGKDNEVDGGSASSDSPRKRNPSPRITPAGPRPAFGRR